MNLWPIGLAIARRFLREAGGRGPRGQFYIAITVSFFVVAAPLCRGAPRHGDGAPWLHRARGLEERQRPFDKSRNSAGSRQMTRLRVTNCSKSPSSSIEFRISKFGIRV